MTTRFQRAVTKRVPIEQRLDAVDAMTEAGERENLATIVRSAGQASEVRRRALEGLGRCHGSAQLERLAHDAALEPLLNRRAAELCGIDLEDR